MFKRSAKREAYETELQRLSKELEMLDPSSDDYQSVMNRIEQLDKIHNRSSELTKTVIPAAGTAIGVAGIYALQQFAGLVVPKALDAIASRSNSKSSHKDD